MTDAELRAALADRLASVDARIAAACRRAGRERAGQTVPHLHVHLLGGRDLRWPPG